MKRALRLSIIVLTIAFTLCLPAHAGSEEDFERWSEAVDWISFLPANR